MRYREIAEGIENIGLPYCYRMFPKSDPQEPPYILYFYEGSDDVLADNTNYKTVREIRIELYTKEKNFALEKRLEAALKKMGIVYSKDETYIDSQQLNEIVYESEVMIDE